MATHTGGKRPFPALLIAFLLLPVCLFPGQYWLPRWLPGFAGLASLQLNLIVLDWSLHLPVAIDLILVPALFIVLYTLISLLYPARRTVSLANSFAHRLLSAFSATILLLVCVTIAGLISYVLDDYLPRDLRKGLDTLGMSANLYLQGYKPAHLQGNIIALLGLVAGITLAIIRLKKQPAMQKTTPLTPEQRMTPYQRMLQERQQKQPNRPSPARSRPTPVNVNKHPTSAISQRPLCFNQPLSTLKPESVNYRPL
ncbi:MAG TPA: hypothetical protein VNW04_23815 [Puia sp.]|nr:hypothetical protein [Puia sp.]